MPVNVIDTLKPKNGLNFPVVEAIDVFVEDYENLADAISHFATDVMIEAINKVLSGKADAADLTALEAEVDAKADSSALATAAANLQAQINEIVTPVTQDAEVQNARVDGDGTTYTTLKERLDNHDERTTAVQNEVAVFELKNNAYVNKSNGAETSGGGYIVTDYIPLYYNVATKVVVADDASGICFYDKNKTFISGYNPYSDNNVEKLLEPPETAAYVRISCSSSSRKKFIVRYDNALPAISEKLASINSTLDTNIEDVTNINNAIYGGVARITVHMNEGYYVNNVQRTLSPAAAFQYSDLIELKAGETITVSQARSNTATVVDLLSKWTEGGTYVDSIAAYSSTSYESAEYTAVDEVEYIRVCSIPTPIISKTSDGIIVTLDTLSDTVEETAGDVTNLKNNSITQELIDVEVDIVDGKYINNNGKIVSLGMYAYTESYELKKGESVVIRSADPAGSNVSRISLWRENGTYIRTVEYGTTTYTTVTYTATEATEYVRFSYNKNNPPSILKANKYIVPDSFTDVVISIVNEQIEPELPEVDYSVAMFETVGFCGDSYVKGQLYNSQGLIGDRPNLAWGSCLGRIEGITPYIYASSGADTNTWQSRSDCLPLALSDTARGLYIFCLGINDATYVTLGSINDITDYESYEDYPNTYYGNYGKIIEQIMAHAPNSKIIIMTPYHPYYNARYVTPISEITEHYGIAMIDTTQSELCMTATYTARMAGGHPTAALHSAIAKDAEKMISKCIADNYDYFKDYAGM